MATDNYLCSLCPRDCDRIRDPDNGNGYCHMPSVPRVSLAKLHFGEEPCISGTKGSGTIFFTGCSLKCIYCQNSEISGNDIGRGKPADANALRRIYKDLKDKGAHNINLVTPTHFAAEIAMSLEISPGIPVCYNTSGYEKPSSLELLRDKVQIYLTDYKYALKGPAYRYSSAPDYPDVILKALDRMYDLVGDTEYDSDGIVQKGIIIRHLILPGNTDNSLKVIDNVAEFARGKKIIFSLMAQYTPHGSIEKYPELQRCITEDEYETVTRHLYSTALEEGYVQDLSSATDEYLPSFDMSGV